MHNKNDSWFAGNPYERFMDSGLREIKLRSVEISTNFSNFEDYWQPFLGGVGPAPSYVMNLDKIQRWALKERLQLKIPTSENGKIELIARAWAIRGRVK